MTTKMTGTACLCIALGSCAEERETPERPSIEHARELADKECEQTYSCDATGTADEIEQAIEECKVSLEDHYILVLGGSNPACEDTWLLFDYRECKANLGCTDLGMNSEQQGGPCHEELVAMQEGDCHE